MPFAFLAIFGLVLLALWLSILPLIYVVPTLERQWADAGVPLNTFEYLIVYSSGVILDYWWICLPLLVLATVLWTYGLYRAVFSLDDLPEWCQS